MTVIIYASREGPLSRIADCRLRNAESEIRNGKWEAQRRREEQGNERIKQTRQHGREKEKDDVRRKKGLSETGGTCRQAGGVFP